MAAPTTTSSLAARATTRSTVTMATTSYSAATATTRLPAALAPTTLTAGPALTPQLAKPLSMSRSDQRLVHLSLSPSERGRAWRPLIRLAVAICQQLAIDVGFRYFLHGSIGFRGVEFMSAIGRFLRREEGPTAVEYAVLLALILLVCLAGIRVLGSQA